MTTQVLFNALTYIDRLVRGGFRRQARASAEALESALSESVATKTDIADLKHEIASATVISGPTSRPSRGDSSWKSRRRRMKFSVGRSASISF